MRDAYSVEKIQAAEQVLFGQLPAGALMQRAAAGLASACAGVLRTSRGGGRVYGAQVVVLAGTGNNGGDALFAGAMLARRGASVTAILAGPRAHEEGLRALRAAGGRVLPAVAGLAPPPDAARRVAAPDLAPPTVHLPVVPPPPQAPPPDATRPDLRPAAPGRDVRHAIGHAALIIDGMLGIGGRGGLREPAASLAAYAASSAGVTVAVDLPSGIDADAGTVDGPAVRADVTVTFGALKPGLLIDPGAGHAGVVQLVDIGLGPHLEWPEASAPQAADIAAALPRPGAESDKYRRGVLGLLAGSDRYTGAALLAAGAAVRGGAGMVRLVSAAPAADAVRRELPEVVVTPLAPGLDFPAGAGRVQAWAAGPGMGTGEDAAARLAAVLATGLPALVDADGLSLLAREPGLLPRAAPTLLTPHAGELGRLLGVDPAEVEHSRLDCARAAAARFGACVALKGSTTVIAQPGERDPVLVNPTGTPWLATAGTGDVLTGLAGALLAQGLLPPQAAITAAYLHGLAARLAAGGAGTGAGDGQAPLGASDVLAALPRAFRSL